MEFEKPMNKDIVEFSFEPKYSPLKREKLSNEIKSFTQFPFIQKQLKKESKIDILNYLIDSLSATTTSITSYYIHHPKDSINLQLNRFHEKRQDNSLQSKTVKSHDYKEISASSKMKALSLIEENSNIRKDNYSIMFDNIKLTLDELLNPKRKNDKNQRRSEYTAINPTIPHISAPSAQKMKSNEISLQRKDVKTYSKSFSINLNDNDVFELHSPMNNKGICEFRPKIIKKSLIANKKHTNSSVIELPTELEDAHDTLIKKTITNNKMNKKKTNSKTSFLISKDNLQPYKYNCADKSINMGGNHNTNNNYNHINPRPHKSGIVSMKKINNGTNKNYYPLPTRGYTSNNQLKTSIFQDKQSFEKEDNDCVLPDFINKFHVTLKEKMTVLPSSSPKKRLDYDNEI